MRTRTSASQPTAEGEVTEMSMASTRQTGKHALPRGPLLVATHAFPPGVGGSSTLNFNIWSAWPRDEFRIVTRGLENPQADPTRSAGGLTVDVIQSRLLRDPRLATRLNLVAAWAVKRNLIRIARTVNARGIWGCWATTAFVVGAYWAAKALNLPLFVHLHDMWEDTTKQNGHWAECFAGRRYEHRVLRAARRVFTITQEARDHFVNKLGVDSYVLDHPVVDRDYQDALVGGPEPVRPVIHFAGRIYKLMNLDAVQGFVRALQYLDTSISFECYTPNDRAVLESQGIAGSRVQIVYGSKKEVLRAQRSAKLLLLPLSFAGHSPVEISTVFPAKLLEYFVSNRPIVVCAPQDSWASCNARRNGWGEVIDSLDPARIAQLVQSLLNHPERQASLAAAARAEAKRRLASEVVGRLRLEVERLLGHGQV